jgi:hypothetical protein
MHLIRKLFFTLVLATVAALGFFAYNRATDGFSVHQMTSSLPPCPQFEFSLDDEQKEILQRMLDQPFHYIGKGIQSYVFASEDDQTVIKFFKHKHLRPFTWLNDLPMTPKLRALCNEKIERRKQRVERLFSSCQLAYEKMREQTGLLFIHLNRTPALEKKIVLVDKLGFKHHVEIDNYEYILQKKAKTVSEVFSHLEKGEVLGKVQLLVDLVLNRCQKGICDRDRSFVQNVAFTPNEEEAIFIDFGQFYEDPIILQEEEQAKDLTSRLASLRFWTERHFPHLAPHIP